MTDWAATLQWPDKLSPADMTQEHRALARSCPAEVLSAIEAEAHQRQLAMLPRLGSGPGAIPVEEIAAMYRLRNFLVAHQVVQTVDELWAALTEEDWAWLRSAKGGAGIETPERALVFLGDLTLNVATDVLVKYRGPYAGPGTTVGQLMAMAPIDDLLRAFRPLREEIRQDPSTISRRLRVQREKDREALYAHFMQR